MDSVEGVEAEVVLVETGEETTSVVVVVVVIEVLVVVDTQVVTATGEAVIGTIMIDMVVATDTTEVEVLVTDMEEVQVVEEVVEAEEGAETMAVEMEVTDTTTVEAEGEEDEVVHPDIEIISNVASIESKRNNQSKDLLFNMLGHRDRKICPFIKINHRHRSHG